jgi:hypothetical protein
MSAGKTIYKDEALQIASWNDVFVERWSGRGSTVKMERLISEHVRWCKDRAPAKSLLLVHLLTDEFDIPDMPTRELVKKHVQAIDPYMRASAMVLTHRGIAASIFRTFLSTALLMRAQTYPHKVFKTIDESSRWLVEQREASGAGDAKQLASWYADFERSL